MAVKFLQNDIIKVTYSNARTGVTVVLNGGPYDKMTFHTQLLEIHFRMLLSVLGGLHHKFVRVMGTTALSFSLVHHCTAIVQPLYSH